MRQGKIFNIVPKKAYASSTYTDKKTIEFTIQLAANTYLNYIMLTFVTVNHFFARWLKEIDMRHYSDNVRILPTNNTVEVYTMVLNK